MSHWEEWRREFTTYGILGSAWWAMCTLKITGLFLPQPGQVQRKEAVRAGALAAPLPAEALGLVPPSGSSAGLLPRGGSISVSF